MSCGRWSVVFILCISVLAHPSCVTLESVNPLSLFSLENG